MMTVAELVAELHLMPQNATVVVSNFARGYSADLWVSTVQAVAKGDAILRLSEADEADRPHVTTFVHIGS